jgi:hypothetical protein
MERGGAQAVPCWPGEAWQGRLEKHLPELVTTRTAKASGQPGSEVLPEAEQHGEEEAPV